MPKHFMPDLTFLGMIPPQRNPLSCVDDPLDQFFPFLQATIAPPAVRNMYKSIAIQYVFAVTLWVVLTFVSYW